VNENRTHLLRPCAATALLNELSLNNSRARSAAANDEAVVAGTQIEGELPGFPASAAAGSLARSWSPSVAAPRGVPEGSGYLRPEPAGLEDPAGEHGTTGIESLAGHDEAELVESAELAQVRAGARSVCRCSVTARPS
jgi:hypothetical protein